MVNTCLSRYEVGDEKLGCYEHCKTLLEAVKLVFRLVQNDSSWNDVYIYDRMARIGQVQLYRYVPKNYAVQEFERRLA